MTAGRKLLGDCLKGAGFVTFASRKARDEAVSWDGCAPDLAFLLTQPPMPS